MDPLTVAIVSALTKLGDSMVRDAYESLKSLLLHKENGKGIVGAAEALQQGASGAGDQLVLQETIAASGVYRDEDVRTAAEALMQRVRSARIEAGPRIHQEVTGDQNTVVGLGTAKVTYREK